MPTKEQQEKQAKRYEPLNNHERFLIVKNIRESIGDSELALKVSIQLQEYARLKDLERRYFDTVRKPLSQLLREVADVLDND